MYCCGAVVVDNENQRETLSEIQSLSMCDSQYAVSIYLTDNRLDPFCSQSVIKHFPYHVASFTVGWSVLRGMGMGVAIS